MNIGFIGLGAMGQVIVPRMLAAGHAALDGVEEAQRAFEGWIEADAHARGRGGGRSRGLPRHRRREGYGRSQ